MGKKKNHKVIFLFEIYKKKKNYILINSICHNIAEITNVSVKHKSINQCYNHGKEF